MSPVRSFGAISPPSALSGRDSKMGWTRSKSGTVTTAIVQAAVSPVTPAASCPKAALKDRKAARSKSGCWPPAMSAYQMKATRPSEDSGTNMLLKENCAAAQRRAASVAYFCSANRSAQRASA